MSEVPGHTSPPFSEDARDDALFHYTSANGLIGILRTGEIWSTAYYCTNDESELAAGRGILKQVFRNYTYKLIENKDPLVETFGMRGVDIMEYAEGFEQMIIGRIFHFLCAYITCFCKPTGEEDFKHGLLSQWRAYGIDGGYALQFSRKKLLAAIQKANSAQNLGYEFQDVHYSVANPLRSKVQKHTDSFLQSYKDYLEYLTRPLSELFNSQPESNQIANLSQDTLESFLNYLIYTKNPHFSEERESRLCLIEPVGPRAETEPTDYFNRGGLIVPFKKTPPATFPLLDCVDCIVIGPNPRMNARIKSVMQMVRSAGLRISVRPSQIPFVRV